MSAADFSSFYLQRATREFAEDLDKARLADDFKADGSVSFLVQALQQGAGMYSEAERERVMKAIVGGEEEEDEVDGDLNDADGKREAETRAEDDGLEEAISKREKKDKKDKKKRKEEKNRDKERTRSE